MAPKQLISNKSSKRKKVESKIPVTLLSGFLGAGKTTLLKHILESDHGFKIALIVNDLAALNIDASLIKKSGLVQVKQEVVQLQNGCICCNLRGDLIREIKRLCETGLYNYIIIESTGLAEPMHVAESFSFDAETLTLPESDGNIASILADIASLDTCVTVVDSSDFAGVLESSKTIFQRYGEGDEGTEESEKNIGNLLVDQIEFANVIILNKTDIASAEQIEECRTTIAALNPSAKILKSCYSKVDVKEVVDTHLFSLETMQMAPGWMSHLKSDNQLKSESEEYGVSSFVYRARQPFHPHRLYEWMKSCFLFSETVESNDSQLSDVSKRRLDNLVTKFGWIIRSKGFCWICSRDEIMLEWSQSGRILNLSPMNAWFVDRPEDDWNMEPVEIELVKRDFSGDLGDRRQEIVFIGCRLNVASITAALDYCLLSVDEIRDLEIQENGFLKLFDPLPIWSRSIDPGFFHSFLVLHRQDEIDLPAGCILTLSCAALECDESLDPKVHVRVWMEVGKRSVLLVTLFPFTKHDALINVAIPANADDLHISLRSEIFPSNSLEIEELSKIPCYVHLSGHVSGENIDQDDANHDHANHDHA